jgi:hypothetical protein
MSLTCIEAVAQGTSELSTTTTTIVATRVLGTGIRFRNWHACYNLGCTGLAAICPHGNNSALIMMVTTHKQLSTTTTHNYWAGPSVFSTISRTRIDDKGPLFITGVQLHSSPMGNPKPICMPEFTSTLHTICLVLSYKLWL